MADEQVRDSEKTPQQNPQQSRQQDSKLVSIEDPKAKATPRLLLEEVEQRPKKLGRTDKLS